MPIDAAEQRRGAIDSSRNDEQDAQPREAERAQRADLALRLATARSS